MRVTESKLRRIIKNILVEQSAGDPGDFEKGIYDAVFRKALNDEDFMSQMIEIVKSHYQEGQEPRQRTLGIQKVIKLCNDYLNQERSFGGLGRDYMKKKSAELLKAAGFEPKPRSR